MERSGKDHKIGYLFLVILRDVAEELAGLPKQDILLAKLFLQELLRHKGYTRIRPQSEERGLLAASDSSTRQVLLPYREVADAHGVLQQPLEADGPARHPPLGVAPVALDAGKAGIAVQAVVAAAALQLRAVEFCSTHTQQFSVLGSSNHLRTSELEVTFQ